MSLPKFEYIGAGSVAEACNLLVKYRGGARVIAGGTDLLVNMKEREISPKYLIGLKGIRGLHSVTYNKKEGLRIVAMATCRDVINNKAVKQNYGSLADALEKIGTVQVRNLATVGGNLCNASPSADSAPILLVLAAKIRIAGAEGKREVPLERFFRGPGKTALRKDEILLEIVVPDAGSHSGSKYEKFSTRSSVDLATVGAACWIQVNSSNRLVNDVRIALGAVAPVPFRAKKAEKVLKNKIVTDFLIEEAAQAASQEASPISDLRASADYRREMVKVMVRRAIKGALEIAAKGT